MLFGEDKVCKQCKKSFLIVNITDYSWKYNNHYFCGYNCMRKYKYPDDKSHLKGSKYIGVETLRKEMK